MCVCVCVCVCACVRVCVLSLSSFRTSTPVNRPYIHEEQIGAMFVK